MVRLALPVAATAMIVFAACGGGGEREEPQPEIIATVRATDSPTPTAPPTAVPVTATIAATRRPSDTPAPTDTPTPAPNQNPSFPQAPLTGVGTSYQRDGNNVIEGAVTTMVSPAATDPDGDPLTYSWSVTTGSITNVGLKGTWVREIVDGQETPGKVAVTASDGRGGTATFNVDFQ
jgi:hypothetical protein